MLGQQAVGEAGLRAGTGTAGDTGAGTGRHGQAGEGGRLPVRTLVIVTVMGALLVGHHHPAEQHRTELTV